MDKRSFRYREQLKAQKTSPEQNLSEQLHNQVAKKIIESLLIYAYTSELKSYRQLNEIFFKSSMSEWYDFLKQTSGSKQISKVLENPERATAQSFYVHTLQVVEEQFKLKSKSESDENFFDTHMQFGWSI